MTLLHVLSYVGSVAAFLFVTLSLASGLLWLAELIEEHSKMAKTVGMRSVYAIMVIHVLLLAVDRLPFYLILFSLVAHAVYLTNFTSSWPFISLTSPRFLVSCVMVVADHFLWFFHFAAKAQEAKAKRSPRYRYGAKTSTVDSPSFTDVAAFFAICVWLVPLFLFLSLSANDNVLPSQDAIPGTPSGHPSQQFDLGTPTTLHPSLKTAAFPRHSLVKSILAPVLSVLPRLRSGRKRNDEGIIAPRTPLRNTPLPSPTHSPKGYSPWGAPEQENPNSGSNTLGVGLSPNVAFQQGVAAHGRFSPSVMTAPPPPRRAASEMYLNESRGASSPSSISSGTSHRSRMETNAQLKAMGTDSFVEGSRSASPVPIITASTSSATQSNPNTIGLTSRKAGRKDD